MSGASSTASEPYVTPVVRAEAARLGVDLKALTGTGVGGRIRRQDVQAAAGVRPGGGTVRAEAPARRTPVRVQSKFDDRKTIELDVYGSNPLVDDARLSTGAYPQAVTEGAPPTMFADGELPPFTASGVDPRELRKVPWYARHAVAAEPQPSKVLAAIEHFAHDVDDFDGRYQHPGARDYENRVRAWLAGPITSV